MTQLPFARAHNPAGKSRWKRLKVAVSSYCGQCPQFSITSSRPRGISEAMRRPSSTGPEGSLVVQMTNASASMARRSSSVIMLRLAGFGAGVLLTEGFCDVFAFGDKVEVGGVGERLDHEPIIEDLGLRWNSASPSR